MTFPDFCESVLGFTLADFQRDFAEELDRTRPDGRRVFRLGILGIGRGGGKTQLSSALALYELLKRTDAPSVLLAAGVREQAEIALGYISRWIKGSPELRAAVRLTKREVEVPETGGRLRVLSSLGDSAFGETPDVIVADEVHIWKSDQHAVLWDALVSGLGKKRDSVMIAITTAPGSSESLLAGLLEKEFGKGCLEQRSDYLRVVADEKGGTLTHWWSAPAEADIDDELVWRAAVPQQWKTIHELRFERGALSEQSFRRLILNQESADPEDMLISREAWAECARSDMVIPEKAPVYVGIETSLGAKVCAVGWLWRSGEGRLVARSYVFAIEGEPSAADERHPGRRVDMHAVEKLLVELGEKYRIMAVAYDHHATRVALNDFYSTVDVKVGSSAQRENSRRLFSLILNGELIHCDDPVLSAHVLNTRGDFDSEQRLSVRRLRQGQHVSAWYALVFGLEKLPDREPAETRLIGWL